MVCVAVEEEMGRKSGMLSLVAGSVVVVVEDVAKSLLKSVWFGCPVLLGELKIRMSQRRSCLLVPAVAGCGLVERREVSMASSLATAFLWGGVSSCLYI